MSHLFDDVSRSLAQPSMPRRESLRRLGVAVTAIVLGPLAAQHAQAGKRPKPPSPPPDPCKAFCKCSNKRQLDQCLKACKACGSTPRRLGGSCGNYFCCGNGLVSCGAYCADLADDPFNCGECGYECDPPGPNGNGGCLDGYCVYACVEGAVDCNGTCTFLGWNPNHCGACGHACTGSTPYCNHGTCSACSGGQSLCNGTCVEISLDPSNCGGCGVVCGPGEYCMGGSCQPAEAFWGDGTY